MQTEKTLKKKIKKTYKEKYRDYSPSEFSSGEWKKNKDKKMRFSSSSSSSELPKHMYDTKYKHSKRKRHKSKSRLIDKEAKKKRKKKGQEKDESLSAEEFKKPRNKNVHHVPPKNPRNPLNDAYDTDAYYLLKKKEKRRKPKHSDPSELEWTHDKFVMRSPSPRRDRTEGAMWNSRRNAWISYAGGAYIPPTIVNDDTEDKLAKYKYPEDFARFKNKENRIERSASSSTLRSDEPRDSPVYVLD